MTKKQRVVTLPFELDSINNWGQGNAKYNNWPSVYTLNDSKKIYVGESGGLKSRFQQHKKHPDKKKLIQVNLLIEETFNKSACLDLESHLIRYFAADAQFDVLNLNSGISEADYYNRPEYKAIFDDIFEELHAKGFLKRSVPELINSLLFKYSPFKSLTPNQELAVSDILETLISDSGSKRKQRLVVSGDPGTGKTIVAVYLMKLLADIQQMDPREALDDNSRFVEFFLGDNAKALKKSKKVALLVPQQSLRETLKLVFASTPGLNTDMVISPFDLGKSEVKYDLVVVDESHRLQVRNNQASGPNNKLFKDINIRLFGRDDPALNQLDWITKQSKNQILFLDPIQTVFNGDLPLSLVENVVETAANEHRLQKLQSQLRLLAGDNYIEYVTAMLKLEPISQPMDFGSYEFVLYDNFVEMRNDILDKDKLHGLGRVLAGYAWEWVSKKNPSKPDIEIEGLELFWNRAEKDWVNSETSPEEVGSIHVIQGYDLNFAGVVIGKELTFNPLTQKIEFQMNNYFDKRGRRRNIAAQKYSFGDDHFLWLMQNIYRVLLTRGIKGTYVYVCDPELRKQLEKYFKMIKTS